MERLEQDRGPEKSLTDDQRKRIGEIDSKYDARIAEEKLGAETRAASAGYEEAMKIREALTSELAAIEEQREREKQAIWDESSD
jgi:hypothetical protein